jgi:hypothetical protein
VLVTVRPAAQCRCALVNSNVRRLPSCLDIA